MSLSSLPAELLLDVLVLALHGHPRPSDVLRANRALSYLGQVVLYSELRFHSLKQLELFGKLDSPLVCPPNSITVTLAGGTASFDVFTFLEEALKRCQACIEASKAKPASEWYLAGPVPLDSLSLCLHSHTRNPNQEAIYDALVLANPKRFSWTGPDPDHHFSTAVSSSPFYYFVVIVPAATHHLFRALRTWTAVTEITLTNLSFPADAPATAPLLPAMPSLRTLYLGQATLLPPGAIAAMVCPPEHALERIRLVDAYRLSIWGPRIRRRDVEAAAVALLGEEAELSEDERVRVVETVRRLVSCEAKTERIMGGDRVEGTTMLE